MKAFKIYTIENGLVETDDYDEVISLTWHREDGPAFTEYRYNGNIRYVAYYVNDNRHRLDGPAIIKYDVNGNIQRIEYWINDMAYSNEQYNKELLKLKVQSL